MNKTQLQNRSEANWKPWSRLHHADVDAACLSWLLDIGSLTQRLIAACDGQFKVEVLGEYWQKPMQSERRALGLRQGQLARIRQVRLLCNGKPRVFARTVIPHSTLKGSVRRLNMLGNKPLGAVLFADPTMRRGVMEIASLNKNNFLYDIAMKSLKNKKTIWGRRSVFYLSGKPLLVNEIFLPGINQ